MAKQKFERSKPHVN
ncbi:hypothetical protein A500_01983, partial [Clostridium sartagoforme AAU1]